MTLFAFALGMAVALVLMGILIVFLESRDTEPGGCGGHHWGDPEPVLDIDEDTSITATDLRHVDACTYSNSVTLFVDAVKRCEDCGEEKETSKLIGSVDYAAFLDEE